MVDKIISYYRVKARTNKWTVRTILHLINMESANSWLHTIQTRSGNFERKQKNHCDDYIYFKLQLANELITTIDSDEENLGYESDERGSYEPPRKNISSLPSPSFS